MGRARAPVRISVRRIGTSAVRSKGWRTHAAPGPPVGADGPLVQIGQVVSRPRQADAGAVAHDRLAVGTELVSGAQCLVASQDRFESMVQLLFVEVAGHPQRNRHGERGVGWVAVGDEPQSALRDGQRRVVSPSERTGASTVSTVAARPARPAAAAAVSLAPWRRTFSINPQLHAGSRRRGSPRRGSSWFSDVLTRFTEIQACNESRPARPTAGVRIEFGRVGAASPIAAASSALSSPIKGPPDAAPVSPMAGRRFGLGGRLWFDRRRFDGGGLSRRFDHGPVVDFIIGVGDLAQEAVSTHHRQHGPQLGPIGTGDDGILGQVSQADRDRGGHRHGPCTGVGGLLGTTLVHGSLHLPQPHPIAAAKPTARATGPQPVPAPGSSRRTPPGCGRRWWRRSTRTPPPAPAVRADGQHVGQPVDFRGAGARQVGGGDLSSADEPT